jgi:lysophospholipase
VFSVCFSVFLLAGISSTVSIDEGNFQEQYRRVVTPFYRSGEFGEFIGVDGVPISYAVFRPEEVTAYEDTALKDAAPRDTTPSGAGKALVLLTGVPESYIKYAELLYDLKDLGYTMYIMDHRGIGFSGHMLEDEKKVHVEDFSHYVDDLSTFMEEVVFPAGHQSFYFLAHSTGAPICTLYLREREKEGAIPCEGAVFTSPLFKVNAGMPLMIASPIISVLCFFGRGDAYAPGNGDPEPPVFEGNDSSHSEARWSKWEEELIPGNPEIQFAGYTNRWVKESIRGARKARRAAKHLDVPVLILRAENDAYTQPSGQDTFCKRAPDCTLVSFPEAKHELLQEKDEVRDRVMKQIKGFLSNK